MAVIVLGVRVTPPSLNHHTSVIYLNPPGNPAKRVNGMGGYTLRVIASGIDTLTARAPLDVPEIALNRLAEGQAKARRNEEFLFDLDGLTFKAKPRGATGYPFGIESTEHGTIFVSDVPHEGIKLELGSLPLWRSGPIEAYRTLRHAANALLERTGAAGVWPAKPSRVDITVDFQGVIPRPSWKTSMVHRFPVPTRNSESYTPVPPGQEHELQERRWGGGLAFTGFTWGTGKPIFCRLYDKTVEIRDKSPDKVWFRGVWAKSPRYVEGEPVWRLEFECRREFLKTLAVDGVHLETVSDVFENAASLWTYLVGRPGERGWIELRDLSTATRRSRAKTSALWRSLQETPFAFSDPPGSSLDRIRATAQRSVVIAMAMGCASTFASVDGVASDLARRLGREPTAQEVWEETCLRMASEVPPDTFRAAVAAKDAKSERAEASLDPKVARIVEEFSQRPPPRVRKLTRPEPGDRLSRLIDARVEYYRENTPDSV